MKVQEIMTRQPACVTADTTIREAAQLMQREDTGIIPVVDRQKGDALLGVITDRDIAIRVIAQGKGADTRVSEVMSGDRLVTCSPTDDVDRAMEAMAKEQVRRIPIVDERGALVGILAQADLVRRGTNDSRAEQTIERISAPTGKRAQ